MSRSVLTLHELTVDDALDEAAQDADLTAQEYAQLLESIISRCQGALDALKEEGVVQ